MDIDAEASESAPVPDLSRLAALIYVFGINKSIWKRVDQEFDVNSTGNDGLMRLDLLLSAFDPPFRGAERLWQILEMRVGNRLMSFDEIGGAIGAGRARAHQLYQKIFKSLIAGLPQASLSLSLLDEQFGGLSPSTSSPSSLNEAVLRFQGFIAEIGWESAQGRDVRRLLLVLRALVRTSPFGLEKRLPSLTYFACAIPPIIRQHRALAHEIEEQERTWTYEDLADAVLEAADTPLHFMEIHKRAEAMERKPYISIKGIHNVLLANNQKYVLTGPGAYGLTAHGHKAVDPYVDIIAGIMKDEKRPLSYGEMLQRVNARRTIKEGSLQMTLDLNVRFYRTQEGTYGLRAWLPPREKQTLRTPAWQVEDKDSCERVGKAIERGYNVEGIVAQDQ